MAEPARHEADATQYQQQVPEHGSSDHAEEAAPRTGVNGSVAPRIMHRHKGDVGRPETNEEIFQGSKMRELK